MKQINIFAFFFAFTLLFGGCEDTNENLVGSRGVAVVPLISNLNPAVFDSKDLENTFVEFKLDIEPGAVLEDATIKVSINGQKERVDYAKITTFPQTVKILAKDAAAKLGLGLTDIKLGDIVNVEIWTTSNGKTYQTSAGFNAAVVCAYDPDMVSGSYHAVSASWGSEGDVTITVDPTDPFIVYVAGLEAIEGLVEDKGPLKMIVNPLNYAVTAVKTVIASDAWGYHNIAYAGSGTLNTCSGTYQMMFAISVDEGSFGNHAFTLTKN
jgi:hypothetical protein